MKYRNQIYQMAWYLLNWLTAPTPFRFKLKTYSKWLLKRIHFPANWLDCIAQSSDRKGHQSSAGFGRDTGRCQRSRRVGTPRGTGSLCGFQLRSGLSHSHRVKVEVWRPPWTAPSILSTEQTSYFTVGPPQPRHRPWSGQQTLVQWQTVLLRLSRR